MSAQTLLIRFFFSSDEFWNFTYDFYIAMWAQGNHQNLNSVQDCRDYVQMYMGR